jgi:hypothetical protein
MQIYWCRVSGYSNCQLTHVDVENHMLSCPEFEDDDMPIDQVVLLDLVPWIGDEPLIDAKAFLDGHCSSRLGYPRKHTTLLVRLSSLERIVAYPVICTDHTKRPAS